MSLWKGKDHDGSAEDKTHAPFPLDLPQTIQNQGNHLPEPELLWFPETVYEIDSQGCEREIHYSTIPHRYNHTTGKIYGQSSVPKFWNRRERRAYHRSLKQNMAVDL
jgi:hypothetical protein